MVSLEGLQSNYLILPNLLLLSIQWQLANVFPSAQRSVFSQEVARSWSCEEGRFRHEADLDSAPTWRLGNRGCVCKQDPKGQPLPFCHPHFPCPLSRLPSFLPSTFNTRVWTQMTREPGALHLTLKQKVPDASFGFVPL